MQEIIKISSNKREELIDITSKVKEAVSKSQIKEGLCHIFVKHATAAIMIQENWDESVQTDVLTLMKKLAPKGEWEHDKQDGNGDSHLKSGLIGPSETVPITDSKLQLGRWQNIFLCEFDGPRTNREIIISIK